MVLFLNRKISKMDTDQVIDFKGETLFEIILINYRWVLVCSFYCRCPSYTIYGFTCEMLSFFILTVLQKRTMKEYEKFKGRHVNLSSQRFSDWEVWASKFKIFFYIKSEFRYKHGIKLIGQRKCAPQGLLISRWVSVNQHTIRDTSN